MHIARCATVMLLALLAGCAGSPGKAPKSRELALESVRMTGKRICGSLGSTTTASTFSFECPPLPTAVPTGWLLSPAWESPAGNPQRVRANRTAVINVSGPGATEIDVELVRGDAQLNLPLEPSERGAGAPGEVSASRQFGVTTVDDGKRKLWMIEVTVSTCAESRHLQIFRRTPKELERSKPLDVYLVRDAGELLCVGQADANPAMRAGVGDPANPRAAGGCAGGGTGKPFQICESCPGLPPRGLSVYATEKYCSWDEVQQAYGYSGETPSRAQLCKLSQVGSREACEGKP